MKTIIKYVLLVLLAGVGVSAFFLPMFDGMFLAIVMFALGLVMVIKGGDVFVDGATSIAKALHIPTFIIGATIVSLATTLPETMVSCFAVKPDETQMAIGNAIGSVTANTAIIMAIAMLAMNITAKRKDYAFQIITLIVSTIVLLLFSLSGKLTIVGCIVLALILATFMTYNVVSGNKQAKELKELAKADGEKAEEEKVDKKFFLYNIFLFIVGAAGMAGGSRFMVNYGSAIATSMGVSEGIIGFTIVAIGTSLPELVTTITAIIKKESSLSIGNIVGANIIDITLILPLCSLVSGQLLTINATNIYLDFPVCILVTLIATLPILIRQKASKLQGGILITIYLAYLTVLILNELNVISLAF